jgi:hypothetical protein
MEWAGSALQRGGRSGGKGRGARRDDHAAGGDRRRRQRVGGEPAHPGRRDERETDQRRDEADDEVHGNHPTAGSRMVKREP